MRASRGNLSADRAQAAPQAFSDAQQLLTAYFSSATVGLAICDGKLRYQAINKTLAEMNGIPAKAHLGKTVRDVLGNAAPEIERAMRRVLRTGQPLLNLELALTLPTRKEVGHWIENYFPVKDARGRVVQVGVVVIEITEQKKLETSLHTLTGKLLRIKDEEQRRLARELHDSISQYHAAIRMNLRLLSHPQCSVRERAALLTESLELLDACIDETRNISHLLHPPLLDKLGFASAARLFVKGFAQRTRIRVNMRLSRRVGRMPENVEIALFRVLQEALSNVHRHAETSTADVWVHRRRNLVILGVRDHGKGIPEPHLRRLRQAPNGGLGLASMRERIHELNGRMEIRSGRRGTEVEVGVPLIAPGRAARKLRRGQLLRARRSPPNSIKA